MPKRPAKKERKGRGPARGNPASCQLRVGTVLETRYYETSDGEGVYRIEAVRWSDGTIRARCAVELMCEARVPKGTYKGAAALRWCTVSLFDEDRGWPVGDDAEFASVQSMYEVAERELAKHVDR
ncbi:MAG: hypothetical protein IPK69_10745 [Phycisphaerales bacterium]|nr:MAG: hypothetical protein IPK69_10745 [Phycisphaerales bacterium]